MNKTDVLFAILLIWISFSHGVLLVYLTQLFKEAIFQYLKRSPLDFLNVSNYSNKRNTRSTSNGMIPFYRCRTKTVENSLSCKIVKCFIFLMSNKLVPDKIKTYSQEQLSKF